MDFASTLKTHIHQAVKALGLPVPPSIHLEHPQEPAHGDYATNLALTLYPQVKEHFKSPHALAQAIVASLSTLSPKPSSSTGRLASGQALSHLEVAGPGFINFWLDPKALSQQFETITTQKHHYGVGDSLKSKTYLLEHTSPNTIKTLHVGHARNNILGMATSRLLQNQGAAVTLDCINNDRGIHIMKAIWAYLAFGRDVKNQKPKSTVHPKWSDMLAQWVKHSEDWPTPATQNQKPDHFMDQFYVLGVQSQEHDDNLAQMRDMLIAWEAADPDLRRLWQQIRDWVLAGFAKTYDSLGSHHDHHWFESDIYQQGKAIVAQGLKKSIFKKLPDGAVLSQLEKYHLPDTIVQRADGTSMYHTQDLALTKLKREKFPSDLYIWDVGPEQTLYLKQLFIMCEQLGIGRRQDYFHLSFGYVFLKGQGKMSSRAGNVISADSLIETLTAKAREIITASQTDRGLSQGQIGQVAHDVALAALKYGLLKYARETDIYFDIDESLSLEGNSGPYLQYTYARCHSVLSKADFNPMPLAPNPKPNEEEMSLLRFIYRFPEVTQEAAAKFAPNLLCNFLFDLAQKYNTFYNKHRILDAESNDLKQFRLALTAATAQVAKNGLALLGISTPEKM